MTLKDYLRIARRRWWIVILVVVTGLALSYAYTSSITPLYRAEATLLVNRAAVSAGPTSLEDIRASQELTLTYAQLVTSSPNLESASAQLPALNLEAPALKGIVSAKAVEGTQLLRVSVTHADPATAALVANAVVGVFPDYVRTAQLAGRDEPDGLPINTVFVAEPAAAPGAPVSPDPFLNMVAGLVLGIIAGAAIVALVEYFADDISDGSTIEALGMPFLGSVFKQQVPKGESRRTWVPTVMRESPSSSFAEAYRQVQANLTFALAATSARIIIVSSSLQGEGKSTTAANLAEALSEGGLRVLLIDGDLRKPDAHRYFGFPNGTGLTSALLVSPDRVASFVKDAGDRLGVLTAGKTPPNPIELIGSETMRMLLGQLKPLYDLLVIDTPPMLGLADASAWLKHADAALLVARPGKTHRESLRAVSHLLQASGRPLLGVVLNATSRRSGSGYGYYGYRYDRPGDDDGSRPGNEPSAEYRVARRRRRSPRPEQSDAASD